MGKKKKLKAKIHQLEMENIKLRFEIVFLKAENIGFVKSDGGPEKIFDAKGIEKNFSYKPDKNLKEFIKNLN